MANLYCDHGAYGLATNRLGRDAPVWGVPQEGDGTSKDVSPAASVASVAFATVPTSGALSIFGASVSLSGVTGAATVADAANALAANINAAASSCSTSVSPAQAELRNMVYARGPAGGAPAGTCQIMARVGSTRLNTATNAFAQIASTLTDSPTIVQFSGGVGGCWGWFLNDTTLGVGSGLAVFRYGTMLTLPYAGQTPTHADTIHVRTGGGASKTITRQETSGYNTYTHDAFDSILRFDTNLIWTGDSAEGKLRVVFGFGGWGAEAYLSLVANGRKAAYECVRRGNFEIEAYSSSGYGTGSLSTGGGDVLSTSAFRGVKFISNAGTARFSFFAAGGTGGTTVREYINCDYAVAYPTTTIPLGGNIPLAGYRMNVFSRFIGCVFDFNISGVADPGAILDMEWIGETSTEFTNCDFRGYASGYRLAPATYPPTFDTSSSSVKLLVDNCSGLRFPSSYLGLPSVNAVHEATRRQIVYSALSGVSASGFRYEDGRGVSEWVPDDAVSFPTAGAVLSSTGLPWSLRLLWVAAVPLSKAWAFSAPPLRMLNPNTTAARTVTVRLFLPSTVVEGVAMSVAYRDTNGVARSEIVSTLSSDSTVWTGAGAYPGFVSKKLQVTTSYPIPQGSEISVRLRLEAAPPSGPVLQVYYDPEPGVS